MSTSSFKEEAQDISKPIWWAGWRPKEVILGLFVIGLFLGYQFDMLGTLGFLGLDGGIGVWYVGTREINGKYKPIEKAFIADAKVSAKNMLGMGGDVETYSLTYSTGTALLVKANKKYSPTTLVLGETSVAVHDTADLDMVNAQGQIGSATQELYFDQIGSVNYDSPHFQIKTADGDTLQYRSSRKPEDALYELQQRIRAYKSGKKITN